MRSLLSFFFFLSFPFAQENENHSYLVLFLSCAWEDAIERYDADSA